MTAAFHYRDGWYFERLEDGSVHIYYRGEPDVFPMATVTIDPASWASIVAHVSAKGDLSLAQQLERAEAQVRRLREVLLFVLNSALFEAEGHDWRTCAGPSCSLARIALGKEFDSPHLRRNQ